MAGVFGTDYQKHPWTIGYSPSYVLEGRVYGRTVLKTRPKARIAVLYESDEDGKELLKGLKLGLGSRRGQIAAAVQVGGLYVTEELIAAAREQGADDLAIHDTVLTAAAFCMFNRYVDGLATLLPDDPDFYSERARSIVSIGYIGVWNESQERARAAAEA